MNNLAQRAESVKNTYRRNIKVMCAGKCTVNKKYISKFKVKKEIYQIISGIYIISLQRTPLKPDITPVFVSSDIPQSALRPLPVACQLYQSNPLCWILPFSFMKMATIGLLFYSLSIWNQRKTLEWQINASEEEKTLKVPKKVLLDNLKKLIWVL